MTDWVRVMTYNIRHDSLDEEIDWRDRRDTIADLIRAHDVDVVGLQEANGAQFEDLSDRLSMFEWVGAGDRTGEFNPIGYRPARFTLRESDVAWLSERPGEPETVGWDAAFARVVTIAVLSDADAASTYGILNTHFDHHGSTARLESARLLRRRIDALDSSIPAVALGDFNDDDTTPAYAAMISDGFDREIADARTIASVTAPDPGTTRTSFDALLPGRHIDHIFVTPDLDISKYAVLTTTHRNGQFPSDHLPVLVKLRPLTGREP